ncbi:MAG: hypothetical protein IPJ82_15340 [Lewinellaceae bacterium]|nr:hypothetical protein [Lewinellaceae bacterium]
MISSLCSHLFYSAGGDVVKVQHTILFIAALQQNNVPVESFFYAKGGHGYG